MVWRHYTVKPPPVRNGNVREIMLHLITSYMFIRINYFENTTDQMQMFILIFILCKKAFAREYIFPFNN